MLQVVIHLLLTSLLQISWYTKQAMLAGIYNSIEIFLPQDVIHLLLTSLLQISWYTKQAMLASVYNSIEIFIFFFFLNSVLRPFQDYFSSYETGQSVGGQNRENPEKNHLAYLQAELGLSHM